jgi:hypothetical protein
MKKLILTAAFAVAVASPALAATSHHLRNTASADTAFAADGTYVDAYTVVDGGRVLGRDPDVFIRQSLLREGDQANTTGGNN